MKSVRVKTKPKKKTKIAEEDMQEKTNMFCEQFDDVHNIATKFISDLIYKSIGATIVDGNIHYNDDDEEQNIDESESLSLVEVVDSGTFDSWPTIGLFTIKNGKRKIEQYLMTWHCKEHWIFSVEHILTQSDEVSDFYNYETKWSIPTKEYPIPQATTSVFFKIEVSRVKPPYCFVEVNYQFECGTFIYIPFKHIFREKRLLQNLEAKLKFYKSLKF